MSRDMELSGIRHAYAKQLMVNAGVTDNRIQQAFATVPRELFLGPGPWKIGREDGSYLETLSRDPADVYTDSVISIVPERGLNNGQPSFHVRLMAQAAPQFGEHAVHVGAGVGYYSALLAELVGPAGRVTAIELDSGLARCAKSNLAPWSQVELIHGDGCSASFQTADVIYVSAGATRPAEPWLDRLAERGRLILPLTSDSVPSGNADPGAAFRIERRGEDYLATWISAVAIYACVGARDEVSERALVAALLNARARDVSRLYRHKQPPANRCWLRAPGWCLAYD